MERRKVICRSLAEISAKPTAHGIGTKAVLLAKDETASNVMQIAKTSFKIGETVEVHIHPTLDEHYLFLEGNAEMEIDGEVYNCHQGIFVLVPAGTKHNLKALSDIEFITISIAL